jgi:hypothetical protein
MSNDSLTNPTPQFGTAEYSGTSGADRCKSCNQSIGSQYYRVNGVLTCAYCGEQAKLRLPQDTHQAFVRSLVFGVGGAILGLILYSGFGILTGLVIGYLSLAVGFIVGKAMMKGSSGVGGRRYQIAALVLTYAAVSMSAIPIGISQYINQQKARKQGIVKHVPPAGIQSERPRQTDAAPSTVTPEESATEGDSSALEQDPPAQKSKQGFGSALAMLAFAGLASPFLELQDPVHGAIGLIILFVGIRIAWKLTAGTKLDILGPFDKSAPAKTST